MRNHTYQYSPEEEYRLNEYNQHVQIWLWIGIVCLLTIAAGTNVGVRLIGRRRRAHAGQCALLRQRPPKGCSRTGKRCSRWVPGMIIAIWRKATGRKSQLAAALYIDGPLAQVGLIAGYVLLNLLLVFLGGQCTMLPSVVVPS